MKHILVTGQGYTGEHFNRLSALDYKVTHRNEIQEAEFHELLPYIDVHILGGSEKLIAPAILLAKRLRLVSFVGTGYGAFIDTDLASNLGIKILSTPEIMTTSVVEHTIGLIIGLARGLFSQNNAVKRAGYLQETTTQLSDLKIGIVGMGKIASQVAQILSRSFNCKIVYTSQSRKLQMEDDIGIEFQSINKLFEMSDVVVLLAATTPQTINLVNESILSLAKPGMLIVNTANAKLVDAIALKDALKSGIIRAAAFDGYWSEPVPSLESDTWGLLALSDDRFIITPHTAAKTSTAWAKMLDKAVDNVVQATADNLL